ncbi:MAG: flagellar basal body rod protein FlgC [Syntrophomonas sp.]|uniref:flagellar basal body rod protein FlgC n=1 Tax=Syntrophomonas sp. TaxID=2053627 RepID=UPI002617BF45|nr:flagellar basal body rod protein FlgC [Syntrophomonas sp.]MDD2509672.1 flagellar basal body rod protein FlgC [Syntrophomonas sp.]MDD3878507.1 flagellar basal body rod protein FlgC [Syntrophomonas sp.]MDD4625667.1 flagellar basal body rod protein FlgC [Syntrophomonas sp.]
MGFLNSIDISASGLTAQRLRLDTIASNMANVETTRVDRRTGPYRRQVVVFEARNAAAPKKRFQKFLEEQTEVFNAVNSGVRVKQIREINENEAPYRRVYDPSHPEADNEGYVNYPNVNIVEEMINMISATRAYDANAQVIEATKSMAMRALDIGR